VRNGQGRKLDYWAEWRMHLGTFRDKGRRRDLHTVFVYIIVLEDLHGSDASHIKHRAIAT
jgi:hypothetical protein